MRLRIYSLAVSRQITGRKRRQTGFADHPLRDAVAELGDFFGAPDRVDESAADVAALAAGI